MSEQIKPIEEQIRSHYAAQAIDATQIDRLKTLIGSTERVQRRIHWSRYAAAAVVLIAVTAGLLVWRAQAAGNVLQIVAMQVVQQHRQPFAAQFAAEDFSSLKSSMTQLAFAPIEPQRCKQDDYRVVGARYATLHGQQVAEIRLAYVDGPSATLYEMRRDQFPDLHEGKMNLDGVPVTFWTEGDLMMALAGTTVE